MLGYILTFPGYCMPRKLSFLNLLNCIFWTELGIPSPILVFSMLPGFFIYKIMSLNQRFSWQKSRCGILYLVPLARTDWGKIVSTYPFMSFIWSLETGKTNPWWRQITITSGSTCSWLGTVLYLDVEVDYIVCV